MAGFKKIISNPLFLDTFRYLHFLRNFYEKENILKFVFSRSIVNIVYKNKPYKTTNLFKLCKSIKNCNPGSLLLKKDIKNALQIKKEVSFKNMLKKSLYNNFFKIKSLINSIEMRKKDLSNRAKFILDMM